MSKLTIVQSVLLKDKFRAKFQEWKNERLKARNSHLEKLVLATPEKVKFYQDCVLSIDARIGQMDVFMSIAFEAIDESTEGDEYVHGLVGEAGDASNDVVL